MEDGERWRVERWRSGGGAMERGGAGSSGGAVAAGTAIEESKRFNLLVLSMQDHLVT